MPADAMTTGVNDMGELKDLAALSPRINAATNELNQALGDIQEELNKLALGVEVWLHRQPLTSEDLDPDDQQQDGADRCWQTEELGYGRYGDGWGLLVRTVNHHEAGDTDGHIEIERKFLTRSARALRVGAVGLIPALVDTIKAEAENVITAVEKAKQIAKSLK